MDTNDELNHVTGDIAAPPVADRLMQAASTISENIHSFELDRYNADHVIALDILHGVVAELCAAAGLIDPNYVRSGYTHQGQIILDRATAEHSAEAWEV